MQLDALRSFIALGWWKLVKLRERSNRRHPWCLRSPSATAPLSRLSAEWVITNQNIHDRDINVRFMDFSKIGALDIFQGLRNLCCIVSPHMHDQHWTGSGA
ncbi:hypothetical protein DL546_000114 [Coniochaeta pulveracea]|uniref:Uncharacterized protein n=1 Tax=Coniochaeta pulveracea TaxID=177199 RepID=A0A420XZ79_9PEZI|nr:hypothetical protein DL546_000114 [Coniochaeta pulveracea]